MAIKTREEWLQRATNKLRPWFKAAGSPLPAEIAMSCGFTSKGMRSNRIGECWHKDKPEVFIVPGISDSVTVADILLHELVHAAGKRGHGKEFKALAIAVGLEGKMTSASANAETRVRLAEIVEAIGEYPHAALEGNPPTKKQSTRMLKMECDFCGFIARSTAKWLGEVGPPICACEAGEPMRVCE